MKKTITTVIAAALLATAGAQTASAGTRDHRKAQRSQAMQSQQFRDTNAFYAPGPRDEGYVYSSRLQSLYQGGAISAPAGQ